MLLSANEYSAELAEQYGWINRALPAADLDSFVEELAFRIARFPLSAVSATLRRVNEIALPPTASVREDMAIGADLLDSADAKTRIAKLFDMGLQQDSEVEANISRAVGQLA